MKKIINFVLTALIMASLVVSVNVAFATPARADTGDGMKYPKAPLFLETVDDIYYGFELESESDKLALYVNDVNVNIAVLNKKTGFVWSSFITEEQYGGDTKTYDGRYYSIFYWRHLSAASDLSAPTIRYASTLMDDKITTENSADCYLAVDHTSVENGIRVIGYDSAESNQIVLDFALDKENEALTVSLDTENFCRYNGRRGTRWILVDILPYFGAAADTEDGYAFYPDGSGTIAEFTPHHTSAEASKSLSFYSIEMPASDTAALNDSDGIMPVLYPVFGMKRGNDAMFGIVTDGDYSSGIMFEPAGNNANFTRIYPQFYTMEVSAIKSNFAEATYKDGMILKQFYRVEYRFLEDDDANYSGMAKTYRQYLLDNDLLIKTIENGAKLPLALSLFINYASDSMLGTKSVVDTSFSQAQEIIEDLHDNGITDMLLNLEYWQKYGYIYENVTKTASAAGGDKALKNLANKAKELGYDMFLEVDMQNATKATAGFKSSRDAAKDRETLSIISAMGFLIAPNVIRDRYDSLYKPYMSGLGVTGMNYRQLGHFIHHYYYNGERYKRKDTVDIYRSLLEASQKELGKNAVWYCNQYALRYADWVYDLPSTHTGYANTTREVPFAQLVLHGYIPYSSIAGNTFYDDKVQTLKWIEYGYIPYYNLTYEASEEFFSSKYSDWKDSLLEKYNMMQSEFGYLYSQTMVRHEQLADKVFVTTYEDGTKVYVNYNKREYKTNDGIVGAQDYLVVKG